jgi:hypothetical protein
MGNNKKIKSFFDKDLEKKHINRIRNRLDMSKIWNIMLASFVFAIIIIVVVNLYLLFQISSGEIFLAEQKTPVSVETISRTQIQETIGLFDRKAQDFENLKSTSISDVVDPSL